MTITRRRPEKKIPVEQLQENYLSGPADESIDQVADELKENQVVVIKEMPRHERIIFRNQRDPGHPLEFHYASASHPFKQYKLIDGQEYDLPHEVIINLERCREDIHKYRRSSEGIPEVYVAGYKTHFVCERAA
jgi:hypothetical protein